MKGNNKISIWGDYPPPFGGLSIHIQREAELLRKKGDLDKVYYFHFNQKILGKPGFKNYVIPMKIRFRYTILEYLKDLFIFILKNKASTVHFHNSLDGAWMILFINLFLRKKIVITIHDQMRIPALPKSFDLTYIFINTLFKNANIKWIAVNPLIKNQLIGKGVFGENVSVIPAYLKPIEKIDLPKNLIDFCIRKTPLLSVYAFSTNLYNGEDLYGIDLALSLVSRLKNKYNSIGLVICIPGRKDQFMIDQYNKFIELNNLQDQVFFQFNEINDCSSLWALSSIYLRPTNTDGDSVAVREALDVSCVSLASDCVIRPAGCILFANRDIDDLYKKAVLVLERKDEFVKKIPISNDFYPALHKVLFDYAD